MSPDLVVAGAGMAGLAAAAHARELGASVLHLEAAAAPGGAMRHSSGVFWRHASFEAFRAECPDGDEALQRALFERLDGDLDWLEARGARVTEPQTGNPRTVGRRFDTASVVAALAGELECSAPLDALPAGVPVVLATGGFAASRELLREHVTPEADELLQRCPPHATGRRAAARPGRGRAHERRARRDLRARDAGRAARARALDHRRAALRPPRHRHRRDG